MRKVILEADFLIISKNLFIFKPICVNIYISNIFFIYLKIFKRNIYSGDLVMKLKMLGILCLYSIGTQCVLTKEEAAVIYAWAKTMPEDDPLRLSIEARLDCENSSDSDDTSRSSSLTPPLPLAKAYTAVCRGGGRACVAEDDVVIVDVFQDEKQANRSYVWESLRSPGNVRLMELDRKKMGLSVEDYYSDDEYGLKEFMMGA